MMQLAPPGMAALRIAERCALMLDRYFISEKHRDAANKAGDLDECHVPHWKLHLDVILAAVPHGGIVGRYYKVGMS